MRIIESVRRRLAVKHSPGQAPTATRPAPVPVDYVRNHVSGEEYTLEVARLLVGEWQPESERAELAAFLADRDPSEEAQLASRDFTPLSTGAVVLSRGVRFEAPPAVSPHPAGGRRPSGGRSTGYAGASA